MKKNVKWSINTYYYPYMADYQGRNIFFSPLIFIVARDSSSAILIKSKCQIKVNVNDGGEYRDLNNYYIYYVI